MNPRISSLRALAVCALILFGSGLTAAGSQYTYVVVLQDRASADGSPAPGEPDIPALGGEVLHRAANRRVVRISAEGIRALAAHRGVKYIQRVQIDDSLPPLPQSPRPATIAVETTNTPAPTWYSGEYVYDNDGNIVAIGTETDQSSDGGKESYVYDTASRLADATLKHDTEQSEKYTYDSFGNLVNTARTAGSSTATPTDIATNRLTGYSYDQVGNAWSQGGVTTYIYDGLNMIREQIKSNETALYMYTADDERIGVYENGEQRWMIRDLSGKVLREWESTGSVWTWREDHIYRNGTLTAGEREAAEGGRRYFHLDHLGTPRLITDANAKKISAHDYYPFGMENTDFRQEMLDRGTSWPEAMKFTGHERDFSGGISTNNQNQLDYMHARYYSPVAGRFLSVDPVIDMKHALRAPQMWNRYTYVSNNPINAIDPDGRKVQVFGKNKAERDKAYQLILDTLPESDRRYVHVNSSGVVTVDQKAEGGTGLSKLKKLARSDVPMVRVQLAETATVKASPDPMAKTKTVNLQMAGGGTTRPPALTLSGDYEVYVDPRGSFKTGAPALEVMAHELMGHAWDWISTGTTSEDTARATEYKMMGQLGISAVH